MISERFQEVGQLFLCSRLALKGCFIASLPLLTRSAVVTLASPGIKF